MLTKKDMLEIKDKTLPTKPRILWVVGFFSIFIFSNILMPLPAFADSAPTVTSFSLNSAPGMPSITSATPGTKVWVIGTGFATAAGSFNSIKFTAESGPAGTTIMFGNSDGTHLPFAVPDLPPGAYKVTVSNGSNGIGTVYQTFTIIAPSATTEPSLVVTTPVSGETLTLGSQYTIRWSAEDMPTSHLPDFPNFSVNLLNESGSASLGRIAINLGASATSYVWTVGKVYADSDLTFTTPLTVPDGRYRAQVKSGLGINNINYGYFTIVAPAGTPPPSPQPPPSGGGGGFNQPNITLSSSKPVNNNLDLAEPTIIATLTSAPYFVYLSQVPYTGFGDSAKLILFLVLVALWSGVIVYIVKHVDFKKFIKRAFRNVENEPQFAEANMSGGLVYDISNDRVLTMDMNPVNDSNADIFVPKYGIEHSQSDKDVEASKVDTPTARDYSINSVSNGVSNGNGNSNATYDASAVSNGNGNARQNDKFDLTTDVNSFINLIVRGDEKPVLEFIRKIKDKGVTAGDFATNVVLELDNAYRSKLAGETNRRNIVLSQIISHWNGTRIEAVMNGLFAIVENSYADNNLGTKIALMRIMRT